MTAPVERRGLRMRERMARADPVGVSDMSSIEIDAHSRRTLILALSDCGLHEIALWVVAFAHTPTQDIPVPCDRLLQLVRAGWAPSFGAQVAGGIWLTRHGESVCVFADGTLIAFERGHRSELHVMSNDRIGFERWLHGGRQTGRQRLGLFLGKPSVWKSAAAGLLLVLELWRLFNDSG